MHGREQRVLLRHYLEQGLSKAAVAERLGISRRTVYYWVESGQLDRELDDEPVRYRPRPAVTRKVDPYRGIVERRLAEFPKLSAVRLFAEIKAAGYAGVLSIECEGAGGPMIEASLAWLRAELAELAELG